MITEHAAGKQLNRVLTHGPAHATRPVLSPDGFDDTCARRLADLAAELGFDGWLINLESPLDGAAHATAVAHFLRALCMHLRARVPHGLVVWCVLLGRSGPHPTLRIVA